MALVPVEEWSPPTWVITPLLDCWLGAPRTYAPVEQVLEPLAKIALGGGASRILGNASAADASPDGRRIALLTYRAIFVFERAGRHPVPSGPMTRIDLDLLRTRQVEGIAWDGDALVVANEQRQLFRIPAPR